MTMNYTSSGPRAPMQSIPARDTEREFHTYDRGFRTLELLRGIDVDVAGRRVLDLGAGYGFLSLASVRAGAASVTAVDADEARLAALKSRASAAGLSVNTVRGNLLDDKLDVPRADVAFLIGVVEYAGLWDPHADVETLQTSVFRTALRGLAPGGTLIFGSKNRLWPSLTIRDVHTGQPLVNALPRRAADLMSRATTGRPYRHHIQTPRVWRHSLRSAGFTRIDLFIPYFSYQLPVLLERRASFGSLRKLHQLELSAEERDAALGSRWLPKSLLMAAGGTLRLPLAHSVLIRAQR